MIVILTGFFLVMKKMKFYILARIYLVSLKSSENTPTTWKFIHFYNTHLVLPIVWSTGDTVMTITDKAPAMIGKKKKKTHWFEFPAFPMANLISVKEEHEVVVGWGNNHYGVYHSIGFKSLGSKYACEREKKLRPVKVTHAALMCSFSQPYFTM